MRNSQTAEQSGVITSGFNVLQSSLKAAVSTLQFDNIFVYFSCQHANVILSWPEPLLSVCGSSAKGSLGKVQILWTISSWDFPTAWTNTPKIKFCLIMLLTDKVSVELDCNRLSLFVVQLDFTNGHVLFIYHWLIRLAFAFFKKKKTAWIL